VKVFKNITSSLTEDFSTEEYILLFFAINNSALYFYNVQLRLIMASTLLLWLCKSRRLPSQRISLVYLSLVTVNLFGFIDQSSDLPLKFDILIKYLTYQSGLLFGSALSPSFNTLDDRNLLVEKLPKGAVYLLNITLRCSLYILLVLPLFGLFHFLSAGFPEQDNLTFLAIASSGSAYSINGGDQFNSMSVIDSDNPALSVFPRYIQSKAALGFLLLIGICILFARNASNLLIVFSIPFIIILSGARSFAFASTLVIILSKLLYNSRSKSLTQIFAFLASSSFVSFPLLLLLLESSYLYKIYDRFASFKASLDFALLNAPFGTSAGQYWIYTKANALSLSSEYSKYGNIYLGSEHLFGEFLGTLGLAGTIMFAGFIICNTSSNILRLCSKESLQFYLRSNYTNQTSIILLQVGLCSAGIGAATCLQNFIFYVVIGYSLNSICPPCLNQTESNHVNL
jgi:hypothetical protein